MFYILFDIYYNNFMSVILTSFKKSEKILKSIGTCEIYSVSRWQPYMFSYDVLDFLGAYDISGDRLRIKDSSIEEYKHNLFEYYVHRRKDVNKWLLSLDNGFNVILCCWCPHSKTTKNHINKEGSFICHTGLIGKLINKYRPDIEVLLDKDRHKWLYTEYKPDKYKLLDI